MTSFEVRTPVGGGDEDYAEVTVTLADAQTVTFTIHKSKVYPNTVNVEIDGDLEADNPSLRINLNDNLVFDSLLNLPALMSPRPTPHGDEIEATGVRCDTCGDILVGDMCASDPQHKVSIDPLDKENA